MTSRIWQAAVLASTLLGVGTALAIDRPVSGLKLVLKRSASGSERLTFTTKDPAALFPTIGSADDPMTGSPGGALIEVFSHATPSGAALAVSAGMGWKAHDGLRDSFRFTNRTAPNALSPVKTLSLRQDRGISLGARQTGLPMTAPLFSVGIRITTGTLRTCALFGLTAVRRDRIGEFIGRNAPANVLSDCSDESLSTTPSICGDGIVTPPNEECDGSNAGCFGFGSCGVPGFSNECRCCVDGGPGVQSLGCCNPYSILIPAPNGSGTCVAARCDPPFTCGSNVCQADHTCCAPAGNTCYISISPYQFAFPCCPGLVCTKPGGVGLVCCVPDAGSCTQDGDCCSSHCGVSGTCSPS